ncbi:substrate-binding periplasmic protein [Roseospira goensis]|uniref:Polar amino acid transport system substrate-binding protein n=1 Tax=Roseospira goensis TaxID=391922 RepID=A0A7W6RWG7_9PROT|nr:transporter substrate-binding domain-containing protein [Roseospira goensis]MBB4284495.1 polar amino acid transport system substrate-binding protein [Roseospira goensis]
MTTRSPVRHLSRWVRSVAVAAAVTAGGHVAAVAAAEVRTGSPDAPTPADASAGRVDPITLLVFNRPPYYEPVPAGGYTGLVAGRVARALEAAGVPFTWRLLPPNGHLRTVAADRGPVCAVGWFRTASRESLGLFTAPVYRDRPQVVLTRADNGAVLSHGTVRALLADPTLRLGTKLGYSYGPALDAAIAGADPPRTTVSQDDTGLVRMLLGRRFDYMIVAAEEGDAVIDAFGVAGGDLATVSLPDMPPGNSRHLLCSRSVGAGTIARINTALAALAEDGR